MGVTFSGFNEFDNTLKQIESQGPKKMNQFVSQEAEVIRGKAQDNTPVDTGHLKGGWKKSRAAKGVVEVYNNVEYAAHVEYGHRVKIAGKFSGGYVKGSKMLHRAMLQAGKTFRDDAAAIIKAVLDD